MVAGNATVDIPSLKARNPLGDTVEAAGIALKGKGRVRQGVCPFHEEVEGSFTVYADSERFYCFGCGAGGDVLDFVGRIEGLTLPEAIRRLDGDGTTPVVAALVRPKATIPAPAPPPRDPALLTATVRFYAAQLRRSRTAMDYLASRGISADAARQMSLGYAVGNGLRDYLASVGFDPDRQRASGLFLERGAERFAGMVVVPEVSGGLVHWLVGRAVDAQAKPRFQALPGQKPVLGLVRLGPAPSVAIVAEGVFDYLALASWGYPAVAALGTQGMDKVATALRGSRRVFLAFDNDEAGNAATDSLRNLLSNRAAVVNLPDGIGDVGELANRPNGQRLFRRLLQRAAHKAR